MTDRTTDRLGVRNRAVAAAVAVGVALLAFMTGAFMLADRTSWRAEAHGALQVVPTREPDWVTAYKEDLLTRETILPTYGAIVGDERFVDEAARSLGLSDDARPSVSVGIEAVSSQAFITVAASASSPHMASAMATGVLRAASRYISSLERPYGLNTVEGFDTGATQQSGLSKESAVVLAVVCALGGLALYRVLSWAVGARTWLERTA